MNIRRIAAEALEQWEDGHTYAETLVQHAAEDHGLSPEDRNLLNALVIGCIRHKRLLDHWIGKLRDGSLDIQTRCHLRVGVLQLLIMKLPDHAAVNETVNSARKGIRGLINAILRNVIRQRDSLLAEIETLPPAVRYSHPDWLVEKWTQEFGEADTLKLLEWNQQPSQTIFRTNALKPEAEEIVSISSKAKPLEGHPSFYTSQGLPPRDWINEGFIYIQDPATMHAVELLAPQAGETVLDACAAPGGKSTQIAAAMKNQGSLLCTDSNERRLPRLFGNLTRAGIDIATTEAHDWSKPAPAKWHQHFDAILLDVPCSNTGVLRKRIDARWRIKPENIESLIPLQTSILENALACLKPGGRLVYSTCSIDSEENTKLIQSFLNNHPELSLSKEDVITPQAQGTDGAYAALLSL
ncbi:ribosomal RNA small subunit methyltransferase B [Rubritalea halochordaticola]|uniref:16S rRNA (cytosine(967)-C(5))-methyltransferase n=1 Tax=Rubritalea halochordaticola TaxID=714537 RepID=A0ABP9UUI9_9BACT